MNRDEPDDALAELEARLRAWQPAAVPAPLLARLLAVAPLPRRRLRWSRSWTVAGAALALVAAGLVFHDWQQTPSPGARSKRYAADGVQDVTALYAAWPSDAGLTMNLATGVEVDNAPAPWLLDGEIVTDRRLFPVHSSDGKLPWKVDCHF